jgi:hypothetical protein
MTIKFYDEKKIDKDIVKCTVVFLDGIKLWFSSFK